MNKNVKNQKSIVLLVILAVALTSTQIQTLPASASLTFSTEKITVPNSDRFGWTIQKLDNGFAVGEPYAGSDESGSVRIFDSDGNLGSTIQNPGTSDDNFGYSLGALGNILAVGAPGTNGNSGTVYLFDVSSPTVPTRSIQNPSGLADERMGEDQINFLGSDLLVGISKAKNGLHQLAGVIYEFRPNDGTIANQYSKPDGINDNDLFGRSIAVSDPLIMTGAHGVLDETGEAHIFGASNLISIANPNINPKQNDQFGWSTEITPNRYIVGAPGTEVVTYPSNQIVPQGIVYLFDKVSLAKNIFTSPDATDFDSGQNIDDHFGYDIAASDNLILIGAPYDDVEKDGITYIDAGSVYLFQDGNLIESFHNPDPANGDFFGQSVEISSGHIIIGAPGDAGDAGAVYYTKLSNPFAAKLDIRADPNPVAAGDDVTFTYTVTNIGTSDLTSFDNDPATLITVVDNDCSDIQGPFGDTADATLNVGEAWTFTCTKPAPSDPFTEAVDEGSTSITFDNNGDPQTLTCNDAEFLCNPVDVNIVSGELTMAISAVPQPAVDGQTVNVTFDIFNTGTASLFIEGTGGVVDNNGNCNPIGENPHIIELQPQANTHFTCQVTATKVPIVIDAVVTARDSVTNQVVTASAQYPLNVIIRDITLDISAQPDPTYIGTLTTMTYNVTNTGNTSLTINGATGVLESTASCTPFAQNGMVTMQPGDFIEFTCTVTGTESPINFAATATAFDQNNNVIHSNPDTFVLNSISPKITLGVSATPNPVNASSTTTLTATVTNTGNSVLTINGSSGITNGNNGCTPVSTPGIHLLGVGNQIVFTCTNTAGLSAINFDLTANAFDENHNVVSDHQLLTVGTASLNFTTTSLPAEPIPYNTSPTVTFTVINNGSVDLTDVIFDETLNSQCTPQSPQSGGLISGDSRTYQCTIPNVTQDIVLRGIATGTYSGGQFVKAQTVTLDVASPPTVDVILSGIIRDFKISHPDFEYVIANDPGIVKNILGDDKEPIYNGHPATVTTTGLVNYNQWYNNVNTVNDCTTYDITLKKLPSSTNFVYSNSTFFPIDGKLFGNEGNPHNYHFTYQVKATFVYQPGQTITMTGDDDIWIFINGKLALDQGGVQPPRTGTINLNTLGLTAGQTYDFALFFAERHTVQSDLGITTNIQFTPVPPGQCKAVDAVDDAASTNGPPVTINVLSNDVAVTSVRSVTQPAHGSVTISGTSLIYTPAVGFVGTDLFTYEATNASGLTDTAAVTVTASQPVQLYCGLPESAYSKVIRGTNGNDNLVGTNGNDLIIGNGGNDTIKGKDGNDCIMGSDGNDKIWGGKGNDTIEGNAGNDNIYGQDGNDTLAGGDGNDKIWGGKGNDTIEGNAGNDNIYGQDGNDTITDDSGNNKIWGGKDNDVINSGGGNDNIYGQDGNDTVSSGDGDDKIWGGKGNDTIDSGSGNDKVQGNQDNDNIVGGNGNDWLSAGNGNDIVYAGAGDDKIFGKQGNDQLYGEDGKDTIHAGAGNDNIFGGNNDDLCYGESGNDTFNSCESIKAFNDEDDEAEEPEELEESEP